MSAPANPRRTGSRCPGPTRCAATCGHRAIVEAYQTQRDLEEMALEAETNLLPGDVQRYLETHEPLISFKRFLVEGRGSLGPTRRPDVGEVT